MTKRQYSDNDKANALLALDANAGNMKKTSREIDIPISTIHEWRNGNGISEDVPQIRALKGIALAERIDVICAQILESIPEKIADANISQATTAYGTLFDKKQLVLGNPTSINENRDHLNPVAVAAYAKKRGISLELADAELTQTADEMGLTSELTQ